MQTGVDDDLLRPPYDRPRPPAVLPVRAAEAHGHQSRLRLQAVHAPGRRQHPLGGEEDAAAAATVGGLQVDGVGVGAGGGAGAAQEAGGGGLFKLGEFFLFMLKVSPILQKIFFIRSPR